MGMGDDSVHGCGRLSVMFFCVFEYFFDGGWDVGGLVIPMVWSLWDLCMMLRIDGMGHD